MRDVALTIIFVALFATATIGGLVFIGWATTPDAPPKVGVVALAMMVGAGVPVAIMDESSKR